MKLHHNMMGEVASHVAMSLTCFGAMVVSNHEHHQTIDALLARDGAELRILLQQQRADSSENARAFHLATPDFSAPVPRRSGGPNCDGASAMRLVVNGLTL
ncbi:hypothetical protein [Aeromonas veronii]|uniref:hypothetical protein n=1 Tax=Aeromonas veronii TaxID=654 RepID=UPI003D1E5E4A